MVRLVLLRGCWALLLFVAAAGPLRAAVDAPTSVPVRGGLHGSYGRIVFDWPREVSYEARIENGSLVVSFGAPATFEGSLMRNGLEGYAAAPQAAADGRSLALPLSGNYDLKHFRIGPKVVVDLQQAAVDPKAAPAPEGAKETPAAASDQALPQVSVRGGRHDGFSRLVFDWKAPVGEVLQQSPGQARIVFDRPATFDLSAVDAGRLPQIDSVTAASDGVTLAVPDGSQVRIDRSGTKVVLDVIAPAAPAAASAKAPAVEDHSPRPPAPEKAADAAPADAPPADAPAADAAGPTPLVPKAMGGTAEAKPKSKTPAAASTPAAAIADSARGRLTIVADPMPDFLNSQAQGPRADPFTPVTLTFEWDLPAAAATFRRGDNLWLVFDRPAPKDVVQRIAAEAPYVGEVRLLDDASATIMVIRAQPTVLARLSRDGGKWSVDLRPRSPLPEKALAAPVVESDGGGRVRYPVVGAGRMLWVTDPDAGDRLVVVPIRGADMGLTLPYGFPQFRSLQTQQGIVLQPLTPSIEVATVQSGVLVRDRDGLLVSKPEERRAAERASDPMVVTPGLLNLEEWRRGGIENFQANRQALVHATLGETGERLGIARLDLARFYFANGLDSETLGVLQVMEDDNPRIARDPEVVLMKGASQLMLKDYRAAATSLAHPALAGEREALLWQAALAAAAEDWHSAATGFAATTDLIEPYPRNVRLELGLDAAESFIHTGDLEAAGLELARLLRDHPDDNEKAQIDVVQGMLQLAKSDPEEARKLWTAARDGSYRPSQARARLALIELGMQEGTLSPEAATEELERLRFAWRGDLFEFTLLRKLANLYVEQNRQREALLALREAVTNFPDSPAARNAAQRMREIFAEVFSGPGDPKVPPIRALALYQEFMELTPSGPEGDKIIAGLADRLVEVDLLDRAAELLEGQVRYRLEGADKARVGARLALVRLLDRKPQAALEALDISKVEGVDGPVAEQRLRLRARALSELERDDEALKLLASDSSREAEQLRADIHWKQRDWPATVDSLSKMVPLLPPRRPMEAAESKQVVNLAVALLLAGDRVDLSDLDRRYGAAMAKGPDADTFKLLVGDGAQVGVPTIAEELQKVGVAQNFMTSYREKLAQGGLSQVN